MDVRKEIAINEAISERVCKPGHTYNPVTKRCYPVTGGSGGGSKQSANQAVKVEVAQRASQGLSE